MPIGTAVSAKEISAGCGLRGMNDLSYSKLIHGLKKAGVLLDRKVLAELALSDPSGFSQIAALAAQQK